MGCRFSKKDEAASNGAVSVCGHRKRLAKAAVEKRKAFAEAHCKYIASLSAVSSAIAVFVACFSSSSPPPEIGLLQNSVDSHNQALAQISSESWSVASGSSNGGDDEEEEEESRDVCEHFYGDHRPLISSPGREIGWDFFNLLDNPPLPPPSMAAVPVKKEKKGMKKREIDKSGTQKLGVKVHSSNEVGSGRELLAALKDLEQHFGRAHESGLLVSRMLEVNTPNLQPVMEEFKGHAEKSSKLAQANIWNRLPSSQASSCKSLISSSSKSSSAYSRAELFDGNGGMESGSHSFTLGRLYAWEKKLYEEVKAAEQTRKTYKQKCSQMKKPQGVKKEDDFSPSKQTAEVTYLYNRILVARRSVESISKQIEKLRDEELQPQLAELLHGLMRTWKIMSECHEAQNKIISGVKSFHSETNEKLCNDSHRLATLQLEKELRNWQSSFLDYISTQKAYVTCLCGWLTKLIDSGGSSQRSALVNVPTLLMACRHWLTSLEKLPEKAVKLSMKSLAKDVRDLWVQQGEEHEAKKKVDGLVKEMDRKALTLKREEGLILLLKPSVQRFGGKGRSSAGDFTGRKNMMDFLRMRLESEKVQHQSSIERTQAATLDGLKMGFSSVFESLTDFSRASVSLYDDLVTFCEDSNVGH